LLLLAAMTACAAGELSADSDQPKPKVDGQADRPPDHTKFDEKALQILRDKKFRPYYTAFPALKSPTQERKEVKSPDGTTQIVFEETNPIRYPALPVLAADAPPLRRVQIEQIHEGLDYLERMKETIRIGNWNSQFFQEYMNFVNDVFQSAANLEDTPAKRIPWYEARVRKYKEFERFTGLRVINGNDAPQRLNQIRFQRLRAEAELLTLKADIEKPGGR
jgi:hypothetical protein